MKKITLLSWSDSNIVGDYWTWFIYLTIRKDGTYSVGAAQTSIDYRTFRLPSIYPLRKGRQVRDAIEEIFSNDNLASEEVDWNGILSVLNQHVPHLANEIELSYKEDQVAEEHAELQYLELERLKAPTYSWMDQAKWTPSPWSHYILRGMDNAKRRKAVLEFIEGYRATHGRMPTGTHTLWPDLSVQFPRIEEPNQQRSGGNG